MTDQERYDAAIAGFQATMGDMSRPLDERDKADTAADLLSTVFGKERIATFRARTAEFAAASTALDKVIASIGTGVAPTLDSITGFITATLPLVNAATGKQPD